ncbi:uncharacterized protein [Rutidosis leptorrhynchoides]|uniref:uncharacterized protein n=1 Tax=Rutidosis leptorrhynchoides TaxID=125765 RepID=UPI003A9A395F
MKALDKYLEDSNLTWMQRLHICIGVARAINYIHFDAERDYSVVHRDIKSSKILLDDNRKPKLSGFEHALRNTSYRRDRLLIAEVVGTIGYVDPTYEETGFVNHKSDVYSLGVVLFEILCGRRAFIPDDQDLASPQKLAKQDSKFKKVEDVETQIHTSIDNNNIPVSTSNNIVKPLIDKHEDYFSTDIWPFDEGSSLSSGEINSVETYSSKQQFITLHPLYTTKKLEKYVHMPKEGLLAQLAKSCYDDESLDDMIDQSLLEQIDPESLKVYSETAYNCLKEQQAQRPNIDQIVRDLDRALKLQMRRENQEQLISAGNVEETSSSNRWKGENMEHFKISLSDILRATKEFTRRYLGSGTYGKVYKAYLDLPIEDSNKSIISMKRTTVAIKCIKEEKNAEQGFVAEIRLLTSCKHPNIVNLLGFCDEGPNMILVYEYASNGSLDNYLGRKHKSKTLTWAQRLKICVDVARGLNYLHNRSEDEERIIHRDIKSGNILLGVNLVAKIADFGLSRFHYENQEKNTVYTNNIAGTEVYLDPEYMRTGRLKKAIDIYSFGVVLFEMLSGNFANDRIYTIENKMGIAPFARRRFEKGTINEMIDPKFMEEVDELRSTLDKGPNQDSLKIFTEVAYRCITETQDGRPSAKDVVEELEKALSLQENFSQENLIGHSNGSDVIVAKRFDRSLGQGDHQFLTELEILFNYRHENIIGLEGYRNDGKEKIIYYKDASKRSLDMHLQDKDLTWKKRLNVCIGIASGLSFLHGGAVTKEVVIHRDIKCANILLNDDWKVKISNFGLAAITRINQKVISDVVGTKGYIDPLYEVIGFCTEKSDIYSFGVVLFEILYGKLLSPTEDYNNERQKWTQDHCLHFKRPSVNA